MINKIRVVSFPLGELQANCYFLIQDNNCIIVDPGDSADFILEEVSRQNLKVHALFATHGHFDHVMAAGELQTALNVPFYISHEDLFLLKRVGETAKYFLGYVPEIIPVQETKNLVEGKFQIPNFNSDSIGVKFQIIPTPGHTPGSTCLYFDSKSHPKLVSGSPILFTGDTLFKDGIGRYDFSYSDKQQLHSSIKHLIKECSPETIIYPGHGDSATIAVAALQLKHFFRF